MRTVCVVVFALLLPVLGLAQVPPPPPQPAMPRDAQPPQKTGTARLVGRVLNAETGRPLRRAVVRAMSPELREGRSVSTDADGRWEIKDLPAGRYSVNVSKAGYVSLSYGQRRAVDQGKQIDLADGQTLDKLDVSLPKGSVITGRIVDEFGEPVAGARVSALRYRFLQGQRQLVPFGMGTMDMTDDVGQYRLHGLSPGDYYVSAAFTSGFSMDVSADRTGYAATYYPGTGAVAEAQRVTVGAAQEVSEISFALTPTRVANVSGTVTTSSGRPVANEMLVLTPVNTEVAFGGMGGSFGRTRPDGSFVISNVAAGEYRLEARVSAEADGSMSGQGVAETASMPLTVAGRDISGLAIVTAPGATASGRIIFEGGVPPALLPGAVTVFAVPDTPGMMMVMGGGPSRVRDDWTFEMKGLAGRRFVRAAIPTPGWSMKSVTANDNDVTDVPIEFKPGENVPLEITLTQQMPGITGTVQGERNRPAEDYVVVAFSSDSRRWGFRTRYVHTARPDQSGKFVLKALPPDEYLVVALEFLESGEEGDPELLEKLRRQATTVSLAEGETKTVSLKLSRQP